MADSNGKYGWVLKWAIGALWTFLMGAIAFTGKGVIANERRNIDSHIRIEDKYDKKVETLQFSIDKKLEKMLDAQIAQGLALARIEEKIR